MKRLLCRIRRHPIDHSGTYSECPCGYMGWVDATDPTAAATLRIRAANEPGPVLAAVLTAAAEWIEEYA